MPDTQSSKSKPNKRKSSAPTSGPKEKTEGGRKTKQSVADMLVKMAVKAGVGFLHTPDETTYAVVPGGGYDLTMKLRSSSFSSGLKRSYFLATEGKTPGSQAVADAVGLLDGLALYNAPVENVYLRVAEKDGKLYIDLADPRWRAVEIDASGWRIVDKPPVRFRRQRAMLPLPEPKKGGHLDQLRPFLNISDDADWRLAVAWLLAALRPAGPYPPLALGGQQGSAKSTTARVLRSLVDPNTAPIRSEPREPRDLMIAANAGQIIALDNLSAVPAWLSDCLRRLSTGGGFSTRKLWTDDEEMIFDAKRPVILTSIEDVTTRGDLLERSLILSLPPVPKQKRCPEKDFWDKFDTKYPLIFGALLDALAGALRELPGVKRDGLPRMADFALLGIAAERALGWPAGSFLAAYDRNRSAANEVALESSPIFPPLQQSLANVSEWEGTAGELLAALAGIAGEQVTRGKEWPKRGNILSGALKRLAPNLRNIGINVDWGEGRNRRRITIKAEKVRDSSSPSSPSSPHRENKAFSGDDPQAGHRHQDTKDRHRDDGDDPGDDPCPAKTPEK